MLLDKRPPRNTLHAAVHHQVISNYISTENVHIALVHNNCICNACYLDFQRNNGRNIRPPWLTEWEKIYAYLSNVSSAVATAVPVVVRTLLTGDTPPGMNRLACMEGLCDRVWGCG